MKDFEVLTNSQLTTISMQSATVFHVHACNFIYPKIAVCRSWCCLVPVQTLPKQAYDRRDSNYDPPVTLGLSRATLSNVSVTIYFSNRTLSYLMGYDLWLI